MLEVMAQLLAVGVHCPGRKQKYPFVCTALKTHQKHLRQVLVCFPLVPSGAMEEPSRAQLVCQRGQFVFICVP